MYIYIYIYQIVPILILWDWFLRRSTIAQTLKAARASLAEPSRPYTPLDRNLDSMKRPLMFGGINIFRRYMDVSVYGIIYVYVIFIFIITYNYTCFLILAHNDMGWKIANRLILLVLYFLFLAGGRNMLIQIVMIQEGYRSREFRWIHIYWRDSWVEFMDIPRIFKLNPFL